MTHYGYLSDRKEAFIDRWHAWPTIRHETLAEHNFFVIRNCLYLARMLSHYGIAEPNITTLLEMAMEHDATEKVLGDIDGPVKRMYPDLKAAITVAEKEVVQSELYKMIPPGTFRSAYMGTAFLLFDKELLETQIIKYVDVLDAYIFILTDFELGNKMMVPHIERVSNWITDLNWPWLKELREKVSIP